ncbi:recombinase family protein [Sulfitobacter sp.]|uniref:recombinase family protein n=1 Tax=Sulfitobacter sp. TaxID=1903071 RepID=UPI0030017E4D
MTEATNRQEAVIYCRVSGAKQVREGDGLASQENRCREYAKYKGYDVLDVFTDDVSGKAASRVGMQSILGYLHMNASKAQEIVVIIDDISRLARGLNAHLELRTSLSKAGGKLESPSIEFGEDSDSILVENLLAPVAQHQREKNGEQTANRMRGRMMNGYSVFAAPVGYRYEKNSGQGKILVRDEPVASILQEALEGYGSGRFESQAEVVRYLESCPAFPKDLPNGKIRHQKVSNMLKRVIYAGYIEHADWGIDRRKGHHEGIISLETFERIQNRAKARKIAPARTDINVDFPLRGSIACGCCDKPLTSCWSKSSTGKKYPYYWCMARDCTMYRKSMRAEKIDAAFDDVMQSLEPSKGLIDITKAMLKDAWGQRLTQADANIATLRHDIAQVDKQLDGLLDRIVATENNAVITAYEKKIAPLEKSKLLLVEKLDQKAKPQHTFEDIFELSMMFLANPRKIWRKGNLPLKKTILRLAFMAPLAYDRENGFRTPQTSVIFRFLANFTEKCKLVRSERLEL